ncbi:hypothetical protein BAU15_02445 [Enterococcus sp. JM4C]|uniref:sensor histidine kinase n=1 Tax=Candidatus Enterococcus huntleyi TaxID=1857217 RepID=UPI00137B16EF|nr:HAMP domain-containing sensor histidine kinase [Enterococcus sp. JM4C]KAF1299522.1 hypothetical protein BAU15_02445 [Enterococcus sp. JM4C]
MDWLNDWVERLVMKNRKLNKALFFYITCGVLSAMTATLLTHAICVSWEQLLLDDSTALQTLSNLLRFRPPESLPEEIKMAIFCLEMVRTMAVYFYSIIGIYLVVGLFYKRNILQPIQILEENLLAMKRGDFDQSNLYRTYDEFEKISREIDSLRKLFLKQEKQFAQINQDQRAINSAFSHDMRTPLAILQNNLDLLEVYFQQGELKEEKFYQLAGKMQETIIRLTEFSKTMQEIQKIEEIPLLKVPVLVSRFVDNLNELPSLYPDKQIVIKVKASESMMMLDLKIVQEAMENILTNAYRFAKEKIEIQLEIRGNYLTLFVKDDGVGFSKEELNRAKEPYYSQNKDTHFGMGLAIAEILTRKHGGLTKLANGVNGGAIVTLIFSCSDN